MYAPFEPVAMMVDVYALHAHNELLELAVETGIPGMALLLALLGLMLAGMRNHLNKPARLDAIMFAVMVSAFVPLAHSLVDYPLRTLAVACLFAVLLARLAAPTRDASPPPTSAGPHDALTR